MRDPFPIVAMLGQRLERERTGWRDAKALVLLVAQTGSWQGAAALADALGVGPAEQEVIYREAAPRLIEPLVQRVRVAEPQPEQAPTREPLTR